MRRSAFSIIELMVTIGVIGIVIGILLPAIAGGRDSARDVRQLSDLRQLAASTELYRGKWDDEFPYREPGTWLVLPEGGASLTVGNNIPIYWAIPMHDVAPWREHFETWLAPRAIDRDELWDRGSLELWLPLTSYYMSGAFVLDPAHLDPDRPAPENPHRAVHGYEVAHPSQKVSFWDTEKPLYARPNEDTDVRAMVFVDGHAAERRLSEAEPNSPSATIRGARGIDYR